MNWLGDMDQETLVRAVVWISFVLFVLPGLFAAYRGRLSTGLTHALLWIVIGFMLVLGYSYRDVFKQAANRVSAELTPSGRPIEAEAPDGERAVRIRRTGGGQFVARTLVNGMELTMLVDTGASSVVLKASDAARAGIDTANLSFTVMVETANGSTFCAPVRLREITVGGIKVTGVEALVAKPGNLRESLLGMSFLRRLRSYGVEGDFLTLRS